MANVNVGEEDFTWVADAANKAMERGNKEAAEVLDKLARKINAALSIASVSRKMGTFVKNSQVHPLTWRHVPSTLKVEL